MPFDQDLRRVRVAAAALALAAAAGPAHAAEAPAAPPPARVVRVSGEARIDAAPDSAVVSFAVTTVDASLARATAEATARARKLLDLLRGSIAPADLQTSAYDVQVERRGESTGAPRIAGYRVTHAIQARVRDLSTLGALLDRAVAAGANEIQGPRFEKADPRPEASRALAAAVRDARAKAEEIARAAGVELGELVEVVEAGGEPPRPLFRVQAMAAGGVPVEPGRVEITARVDATWRIR